jgi:hypothetical protein
MEIMTWLSETVKNLNWFKTMHAYDEVRAYSAEYEEAITELRTAFRKEVWTKEDYKRWVAKWRGIYAKLSEESRLSKIHRKASRFGTATSGENILRVIYLRGQAVRLLDLRIASKVRAEESYQRMLTVEGV